MWTLTIDETKVVLSTLQQYFTSPDLNEVLKGDCVEDVMGGLECAEELMKKWEKAELGEYEDQDGKPLKTMDPNIEKC
jgi:hypothetical protein